MKPISNGAGMTTDNFDAFLGAISPNEPAHADPEAAAALRGFTPARIGVGRAGTRALTREVLRFRVDHAAARDSIDKYVSAALIERHDCLSVATLPADKDEFLRRPDLGRRLSPGDIEKLEKSDLHDQKVLLLVGDGLSADAIEANLDNALPSIRAGLERHGLKASRPIFIQHARVGVMDHVGEILRPETVILLIGERPGLLTSESMSAYLCYQPRFGTVESDRNVISNIHRGGLSPLEAGAVIADFIASFLKMKASGVSVKGSC